MNQLILLIQQAAKNPMVVAAGTTVLAEIANKGISTIYDETMDTLAKRIAKQLHEIEKEQEKEKECLATMW